MNSGSWGDELRFMGDELRFMGDIKFKKVIDILLGTS